MSTHDRFAIHELIHRWWVNYDEGHLDVLEVLLTEDCHTSSRTELGNHPHEAFIASDNIGREATMQWKREHRRHSPYPLRHNADQRVRHRPSAATKSMSSPTSSSPRSSTGSRAHSRADSCTGRWSGRDDGYRVKEQHTVLDSIESAPFQDVEYVAARQKTW